MKKATLEIKFSGVAFLHTINFLYFNYVFLLQIYLQNVIIYLQLSKEVGIQCTQKALPDRHKR